MAPHRQWCYWHDGTHRKNAPATPVAGSACVPEEKNPEQVPRKCAASQHGPGKVCGGERRYVQKCNYVGVGLVKAAKVVVDAVREAVECSADVVRT